MSSARRAVVTGIGLLSPYGRGTGPYREALREGRSAVRRIQSFDPCQLPVQIAAEVLHFDPRDYVEKKDRKRLNSMPRTSHLALAAARLALDDARCDHTSLDSTRFGVVFGSASIPGDIADLGAAGRVSVFGDVSQPMVDMKKWGAEGLSTIPPLWLLSHMPSMSACHVSILFNAQGPCNTVTQSDVASLLALGECYRDLKRGMADVFLTGGGDDRVNPVTMVRYCRFAELSKRNDAPDRAVRPFDRDRDGMVMGEGAGVMVLEDLEHARRRGVVPYAELVGFASAFDADFSGQALGCAVRQALSQAGIDATDLDHVNAHGASSRAGDAWESRGLRAGLGDAANGTAILAAKSYMGNLGAGSAIVELAASLLAFRDGTRPATLNYEQPDPECPLNVAASSGVVNKQHVLKVSCTELGQCAVAVFRKMD